MVWGQIYRLSERKARYSQIDFHLLFRYFGIQKNSIYILFWMREDGTTSFRIEKSPGFEETRSEKHGFEDPYEDSSKTSSDCH